MLNILLGIGISGLYMTIQDSKRGHDDQAGWLLRRNSYKVELSGTLIISGITLLITLIGLLIAVPLNRWMMDRKIGWGLVALWCTSTLVNVIIEVAGLTGQPWV